MNNDKLAKLRAVCEEWSQAVPPFGGYDEFRTTFNPEMVLAMLDVVETAAMLAEKTHASPHLKRLYVALYALTEKLP